MRTEETHTLFGDGGKLEQRDHLETEGPKNPPSARPFRLKDALLTRHYRSIDSDPILATYEHHPQHPAPLVPVSSQGDMYCSSRAYIRFRVAGHRSSL